MSGSSKLVPPRVAYERHELDASQRLVLARDPGESLVIVGAAGTGKTTCLVELVAQRVESAGLSTDQIVVLTPQRLAANRLREALAYRLRRATQGPLARTPMSLALECATEAALVRGDVTPRLLTGAEQDRIIAHLLDGEALENEATVGWPESLSAEVRASRVFRNELRDVIDRCIDQGLTADDLARLGAQHAVPEWQAAAAFWSGVLTDVLDSLRFGFGDAAEVMRQATVAVATGAALDSCRLIVVDDAQELTYGTVALLRACASRGITVIVAGNPDETATAFRGAVPHVLGRFGEVIGCSVETLYLSQVHRHGKKIREVVDAIDARIGAAELGTQRRTTVDAQVDDGQVIVIERSQRSSELSAVARVLRHAHVRDGVPWHRMAVVVRQGALVESVARQLAIHEVATRTLVSDNALRDQPLVRDFLAALAIGRPDHPLTIDEAERFLFSEITGMSSVDIRRLRLALRQHELLTGGQRTGPELIRDALLNPAEFDLIDAVPARSAARAARVLARVRDEQRAGATIEELLWSLWDASVLPRDLTAASEGSGLIAEEAHRKLDTVLALFASARRFVERESQRTAQDFIDDLLRTDVPEDTLAPSSSADAVVVCTPPTVIGAEYDVVAVVAVQEGVWPHLRLRGRLLHAGRLDDLIGLGAHPVASNDARREILHGELRMFSLACSRARRTLVVSATNSADVTSSPFLSLVRPPVSPSDAAATTSAIGERGDDEGDDYPLTLSAMTGRLRRELTQQFSGLPASSAPAPRDRAEEISGALARLAEAGVPGAHPDDWYGLKGFSDTRHLNDEHDRAQGTYVHVSPSRLEAWQRNQLGWFIDTTVGGDQTVATGLGTLVHKVFEDVGNQILTDLSAESLWSAVDQRWHELSFEAEWLNERERTRARAMIENLSSYLVGLQRRNIEVAGVECAFEFEVGVGRLVGRIDRVHVNPDGSATIVDLKTGKTAMSSDDIGENVQLACYQLALVRDEIRQPVVTADGQTRVPGMPVAEGAASGGAGILMVDPQVAKRGPGREVVEVLQEPIERGGARQANIEDDIASAADGMAGTSFKAVIFTREERGEYDSTYAKRIHTVQAVCE
ncbi:unannotated protein [freshwater metagenome]|uniref:DNA 3'-5' helicase n=1 Tax=freshwater metagenome TaxID=449393 RepID=A0A6J7F081_9ZZZZ